MSEVACMYLFVAWGDPPSESLPREVAFSHTEEELAESLDYTKRKYIETYGPISSNPRSLTFIRESSLPMDPSSEPARWFKENLHEARRDGRNVIVVMNGFDGLTTNEITFYCLFQEHAERMRICVFGGEPRSFYEVNIRGVLDCLMGNIEQGELDKSTSLFVRWFRVLRAMELNQLP
ncbi:hypothetical protein N7478_008585 [Penicillium angulare]|uniref:uncharacterized protein n=1 Tax=Penicillium angulare TaxID=116970 RepID=UPI0025415C74|nr:uncharacterized protein N7478_008585 [Penicillium angulare]KAJ5273460.1 hypothetical protein N7478_008585 [Penicillium angulare]